MSIRCNPGAPKEVPEEVMKPLFAADPDIVDLERRFKELHTEMKWEYKFIKQAPKKVRKEYEDLRKQLKNAKKSLEDEIKDAYRKDYFFQIHNEMMKRQLNRQLNKAVAEVEEVEPVIEHQLAERTQLQQVLCDFSTGLSPPDIVSRKVFCRQSFCRARLPTRVSNSHSQATVGSSLQGSGQKRISCSRSLPSA